MLKSLGWVGAILLRCAALVFEGSHTARYPHNGRQFSGFFMPAAGACRSSCNLAVIYMRSVPAAFSGRLSWVGESGSYATGRCHQVPVYCRSCQGDCSVSITVQAYMCASPSAQKFPPTHRQTHRRIARKAQKLTPCSKLQSVRRTLRAYLAVAGVILKPRRSSPAVRKPGRR